MGLEPEGYKPRLKDSLIDDLLTMYGAVSIEGPKWCGKTWTGRAHSNSMVRVSSKPSPNSNKVLFSQNADLALDGDAPHLIDEWQEVPQIWDAVREDIDDFPGYGKYILTGSSVPRREEYVHSGTGRITTVFLGTMTLYEMGDSSGTVSLERLFDESIETTEIQAKTLEELSCLIARGGWPSLIGKSGLRASYIAKDYLRIAVDDACRLDGKSRNRNKMEMLIKSLARNESTLASDATVKGDMSRYEESIAIETYYDYMDCLNRIHLVSETPCFRPNVRSNLRVGKTPKRHLTDVSLAVAALGLSEQRLAEDLNTLGLLFEALCEHDLKIYSETIGARLFHYRDGRGNEIDAVVELEDGRWGAFEIKLGFNQVDAAAGNLLKMREMFAKEGCPPSVLCVICGMARYAYTRPDGVMVFPITAMKP